MGSSVGHVIEKASLEVPLDHGCAAHRQRVAELCRRTAQHLNIEGPAAVAVVLAAKVHDDEKWRTRHSLGVLVNAKARNPAFESMVAGMADTILLGGQGTHVKPLNQAMTLAIQILEACDGLDEAVEFAALDQKSIFDAIEEFFGEAGPRFDPRIVEALRRITSARTLPVVTDELPALPPAAVKLMGISDSASAKQLASIVASDPRLTERLLAISNSALFGSGAEIDDLNQAIMRVGVPFARMSLLTKCFGHVFASVNLADLWNHSKVVAAHAWQLATECGYDSEKAYVAGMLHDIGVLVFQRCPASARIEEASLRATGFPTTCAESLVYGTDHAALGSELLRKWNLPLEIVEAVAFHHSPEKGSVLAAILNIAEDEALADGVSSESLWRGLRRATAGELIGIQSFCRSEIEKNSAVWSLVD
jgi:putative nucleotidyltransferase with HDIG domain